MDEHEVLQEILRFYESPTGFIIKLRAGEWLDEPEFHQVMATFNKYVKVLGDSPDINRSAARFIADIVNQLEISLDHADKTGSEAEKLQRAYATAHNMLLELLY